MLNLIVLTKQNSLLLWRKSNRITIISSIPRHIDFFMESGLNVFFARVDQIHERVSEANEWVNLINECEKHVQTTFHDEICLLYVKMKTFFQSNGRISIFLDNFLLFTSKTFQNELWKRFEDVSRERSNVRILTTTFFWNQKKNINKNSKKCK